MPCCRPNIKSTPIFQGYWQVCSLNMTDYEIREVFELPQKLELISEEKKPSLCSFSSYTNSICSDSTIDLDEIDHTPTIPNSDELGIKVNETKPLQNNFINDDLTEQSVHTKTSEMEMVEPSIKPVKQPHLTFSKSVSLHDVSNLTSLTHSAKSNTVSCETINSQSLSSTTKSKDSGFQRSLSCLSLTSGRRSYDHVQSKVKAYIRNIKESEALNKRNKLLKKLEQQNEPVVLPKETETVHPIEKDDLLREIQELKHELHEKSLYIDAQHRNYNKLLLKFAEARNIIDNLRVQSISLSYSDGNRSRNQIMSVSNLTLDSFDYKIDTNVDQLASCIPEEDVSKSTNDAKDNFKPTLHSSPYEKSLSPVRQLFSSSCHLGKNYQPLGNLKPCVPRFDSQARTKHQGALSKSYDGLNRNGNPLLNNHSNLPQRQSINIDLPNDDPFDKVKKWQASLPSINLLGSHSSSDCEDPSHSHSPAQRNFKKNEGCCKSKCFTNTKRDENEVCNVLSQELQNKCIITEMEVDIERQGTQSTNIQNSKGTNKKEKNFNASVKPTKKVKEKKLVHDRKVKLVPTNGCEGIFNRKNNQQTDTNNTKQNSITRKKSAKDLFLTKPQAKLINTDLLCYEESSVSDGDSTHLPKSSSMSQCRVNKLDDDYSDDSSSISSSVLGSDSAASQKSHKRTKRRLDCSEVKVSSKVPKTTKSKSSQTIFIMREPKLNFTSHFGNNGSQINNQISVTKSTNNESSFKHKNPEHPSNGITKTESSQRKAWNARNDANFYVCKDFSFSKSTSLMECIRDMEGLVSKGTFVLSSAIDRNNVTC
ncbi:uncharacterized protein LOC128994702 [Macrosteles quadrilineatus]|uniref:uncharacterized protein LOC128994702 n=1 Tax=Macrosteles quadrilineatus TaxID=74068 RepID=UPI0023E0DAEE|nr:uncharacterized protein LOC128994702 [Macrosteles quadrilineatus]